MSLTSSAGSMLTRSGRRSGVTHFVAAASASASAPSTSSASSSSSSHFCSPAHQQQRRTFLGLFGKSKKAKDDRDPFKGTPAAAPKKLILTQDNLFHPLSQSPFPALRARAERIKRLAPCPVHLRKGQRVLVNFECPDCGWPTHYSEKDWREDTEHGKYVHRLREANEDEHDLRSGREITEFKLPGPQGFEESLNLSSWDVFFYTRNFPSIETERSRRHVSKLLSFPTSMGAVLHEHSPYTTRNRRMTREGLRSFLALRQLLHPKIGAKPSLDAIRVFVVGARAESTLPASVWDQLRFMFPGVNFHLYLIGPEVSIPKVENIAPGQSLSAEPPRRQKTRPSSYGPNAPSQTLVVSEALTITYIQSTYESVHHQMEPFDPYTDVFFAFSPGFGFPSQRAYDRPKSEDEDGAAIAGASSSSTAGADGLNTAAAEIESQDEAKESVKSADASSNKLPNPDATVARRSPEGGETPSMEPAFFPLAPGATPSSTLPTLPPLLQAQSEWATALTQMLSTKCPLIITGFSPADVKRDVEAFESVEGIKGEFEWLITPGENVFGSLSWSIADFDPRVAVKANWGIWAVRGKRYDLLGPGAYVGNPFESKGLEAEEKD
ncbi:hypothetical protein BCV69DRAFT_265864 [Microstroma glucosiphilum]|uniref:Uncharacterized protein n=1 Tax=Pseudomicrostroma glucosiphilum TaxID=1684307 RepID=A0A316UH73_9BASI|nr:hypothetical protein BCV69DRAFT_265864 [Pseudomicrostroma glucosiphilum]PWN24268.1 hypothetical protein BCV69DRAFT_265864 [Pseudomicrostroma glucosiphilum]